MKTVYDLDVDTSESGLVRAPFRVRNELRSAPQPGQPFEWPTPCTSDCIVLGSFDGSFAVVQPIGATK